MVSFGHIGFIYSRLEELELCSSPLKTRNGLSSTINCVAAPFLLRCGILPPFVLLACALIDEGIVSKITKVYADLIKFDEINIVFCIRSSTQAPQTAFRRERYSQSPRVKRLNDSLSSGNVQLRNCHVTEMSAEIPKNNAILLVAILRYRCVRRCRIVAQCSANKTHRYRCNLC